MLTTTQAVPTSAGGVAAIASGGGVSVSDSEEGGGGGVWVLGVASSADRGGGDCGEQAINKRVRPAARSLRIVPPEDAASIRAWSRGPSIPEILELHGQVQLGAPHQRDDRL